MNLSATVYKPNRQHNPPRYAWRKPASKHIRLSGTTGPNGSDPSANRFISKRARARSARSTAQTSRPQDAAQTNQPQDAAGKASPKPASPETPPAKRRSNPQDRPMNPQPQAHRQKAPKIKMGSGPDPDPIGSFQSNAAQLRPLFTATSMFSWQRPLFAVDILDQP